MTILQAFLQGVLQGLTEFLPVSSSGHLSLFQYFSGHAGDTGFLFSILLHAGTLVAVCIRFWRGCGFWGISLPGGCSAGGCGRSPPPGGCS